MLTVNRQSLRTHWVRLHRHCMLFEPCHGLTNKVAAHFFTRAGDIVAVRVQLLCGYVIASQVLQLYFCDVVVRHYHV